MEIRVFLIDDQEIFRAGVRSILADTEIHVVGQAAQAFDAMHQISELKPDIVVLELANEHFDGLEFLRQFRLAFPQIKVVIFTRSENTSSMTRAAKLCVRDYLFKTVSTEQFQNALKNVYYGTNISENEVWMKVLTARESSSRRGKVARPLTSREEEILRFVVNGLSNKEIATTLGLSPDTVKEHLQHIFRKIGVNTRTQAVVWAIRKGVA